MMLRVDPGSAAPAYEQLTTQLVAAVRAGELPPGTKLPTVRQLAGDLGLAPNTVARVYRELEAVGVLATRGRNGTVVAAVPDAVADPEVRAAAMLFVGAARRAGLDLGAALGVIREAW